MLPQKYITAVVLFTVNLHSVHAGWASFAFGISDPPSHTPPAPYFNVQNNVTSFVCLNLDNVFSNQATVTNRTTNSTETIGDSPVFLLSGVEYTRPAANNGGNSSGYNLQNASAEYNLWYIAQGYSSLLTDEQEPHSGPSAAMQLNVYGEADCKNQTHPWLGYSCQGEVSVPGGAAWGAKSVSLQPHDVNAADCLYNTTNGVETSGSSSTKNLWGGTQTIWALSAVLMAITAGL